MILNKTNLPRVALPLGSTPAIVELEFATEPHRITRKISVKFCVFLWLKKRATIECGATPNLSASKKIGIRAWNREYYDYWH